LTLIHAYKNDYRAPSKFGIIHPSAQASHSKANRLKDKAMRTVKALTLRLVLPESRNKKNKLVAKLAKIKNSKTIMTILAAVIGTYKFLFFALIFIVRLNSL
jgi:hypothetical protein